MTFTRQQITGVVKNDRRVKLKSRGDEEKVQSAINTMVSDFVKHGLDFTEHKLSFHERGRSEHRYSGYDLSRYLGGYLVGVASHKMNLKKAIATSLADHLKMLGYQGDPLTKKISRSRALREYIFGKKKSDDYYDKKEA